MSAPLSMRQRLIWFGFLTGFWIFLALIFSIQMALVRSWSQAWRFALVDWLPWMLLSPVVLWIAARCPLDGGLWKRNIALHLATGMITVAGCSILSQAMEFGLGLSPFFPSRGGPWGPRPMGPDRPPPDFPSRMDRPFEGRPPGTMPDGTLRTAARTGNETNSLGVSNRVEGFGRGPFPGGSRGGPDRFRGRPEPEWMTGNFSNRFDGPSRGPFRGGGPGGPRGGPDRFRGPPREPPWYDFVFRRANFNVPVYFFVLSLGHAFTFFRRSQERQRKTLELEARLAHAKLQALRMQLHPHFLFNTLHAISTLVHKDPAAADEMIGNLSELLRATIEDSDQQEVPLCKEMDFLDRYLEIQQVRFGERLRVEKDIDQGVLAARVPAMVLQPLVENALRHGIEPHAATGVISLVASRVGDNLELSVGDSGGGRKPQAEKPEREGIGLANTRARLQELYGPKSRLVLENREIGGFVARVTIPYHE